jgi:hypothetical protein
VGEIIFAIIAIIVVLGAIGIGLWYFAAPIFTAVLAVVSAFLTFGTLPFWLLVIAGSVFIAWCVSDKESDIKDEYDVWSGPAVITVILFTVIISIVNSNFLNLQTYSFFWAAIYIIGSFALYLVLGGFFSWFRYGRFVYHRRDYIEKWRKDTLRKLANKGLADERAIAECLRAGRPKTPENSDRHSARYDELIKKGILYDEAKGYRDGWNNLKEAAMPGKNMERILIWIGLWPWSMAAYFLRDPVKLVYELLLRFYEASYNGVFGKMEEDYKAIFQTTTTTTTADKSDDTE